MLVAGGKHGYISSYPHKLHIRWRFGDIGAFARLPIENSFNHKFIKGTPDCLTGST